METPKPSSSSISTPLMSSLHDVVLDYIQTQAFASTARVLAKGRMTSHKKAAGGTSGMGEESNGDSDHKVTEDESMGPDNHGKDGDFEMGDIPISNVRNDKGSEKEQEAMSMDGGTEIKGKRARFDEEELLSIERRRMILNHILNGAIMRAVDSLNTHFPSVLTPSPEENGMGSNGSYSTNGHSNGLSTSPSSSNLSSSLNNRRISSTYAGISYSSITNNGQSSSSSSSPSSILPGSSSSQYSHSLPTLPNSTNPAHISLNLHIQSFIESFRQLAPSSSPSSPSSSIGSLSSSMHLSTTTLPPHTISNGNTNGSTNGGTGVTLTNALTAAQGLHQEARKLPPDERAIYLQEIKDVGALFAYTDPETSILRGFLDQSRRISLAEQVNRAILKSEGRAQKSQLENYARRVTALYSILAERGVEAVPSWNSGESSLGREELIQFWRCQSKPGFRLKDFVAWQSM